jgi:hypothetical protein
MSPLAMLQKLSYKISKTYKTIPYGGCGVYAAYVGRLLKQLKYPVRIRVANSWANVSIRQARSNIKANNVGRRPTIEEWNGEEVYFGHVYVDVLINGEWVSHDSQRTKYADGTDPTFGWEHNTGWLSVKEAEEIAATSRGWNSEFDRELIPHIKMAIAKIIKKLPPCQQATNAV